MKRLALLIIIIIFFSFLCLNELSVSDDQKSISSNNTYVLAIGICPPWKKEMKTYCKNSITQITKVLQQRINIPPNNIHIILDEQATYNGVEQGFNWLHNKANQNSRAIIYINAHGSKEPDDSNDSLWHRMNNRSQGHEIFVLWTKERPITIDDAIEKKQWMMAKHIRKMLNSINGEKIIIIDACQAGAARTDLLQQNKQVAQLDTHEAFIFSSQALTTAISNTQKAIPLFTSQLVEAIAQKDTLEEAFWMARRNTIRRAIRKVLFDGKNSLYCLLHGGNEICTQLPIKEDLDNILRHVHFSNYHNYPLIKNVDTPIVTTTLSSNNSNPTQ